MKKIVYLILFFMAPMLTKAQTGEEDQKAIVGKWKMIKMEIKDGLYFDVSDKDSSLKRFNKLIAGTRPDNPAKGDTVWIKEAFEKAYGEFKQLFVEFQHDNKYITNQAGAEGVDSLVSGTFSIDIKAHTLARFQNGVKTDEVYYDLSGELLTMRPAKKENPGSVIVYKRTE